MIPSRRCLAPLEFCRGTMPAKPQAVARSEISSYLELPDLPHIDFALTLHGQLVTLIVSCLGDGDPGGGLLY